MTTHRNTPRRRGSSGDRRQISVRSVRRSPMDYRKLARALIALVEAQAAQQDEQPQTSSPDKDAA